MVDLDSYYEDQKRVNSLIGHLHVSVTDTPENISRAKLLRVHTVLLYLLTNVIPKITDARDRQEVYFWVDAMFSITRIEELQARESNA